MLEIVYPVKIDNTFRLGFEFHTKPPATSDNIFNTVRHKFIDRLLCIQLRLHTLRLRHNLYAHELRSVSDCSLCGSRTVSSNVEYEFRLGRYFWPECYSHYILHGVNPPISFWLFVIKRTENVNPVTVGEQLLLTLIKSNEAR